MPLTRLAELDDPDDPDEATLADTIEPDDEPTTIRPTPIPSHLVLWEAATQPDDRRTPGTRSRGRVGKYRLHTRIARGSFGVVYTAHDPDLERSVAIKVLHPTHLTNHDIVQRFLQEARATARIGHPGIVTIHDCGKVETRRGSTAFIAMELLSGESLTSRLARSGRLDPAQACEIIRQVASALEAAHRVHVLHRDLKPDNIYLVPDPAMPRGERVKVLDFGLAKLGAGGQTQLETVFGTPRYMSPEQSRSATQIDHRSDIYSLGCVLFELVTGRPPFDGDVRQLIERHQRAAPPRAASLAPAVSTVLDDLIDDMLAKDPMQRPQTMGAVQRALRVAAEAPAAASQVEAAAAMVRPLPALPPPAPVVRPPSSPPLPWFERPADHAAPAPAVLRPEDGGALSGELLVPPSGAIAAPPPLAAEPRRTPTTPLGLCMLVIAVLAAIAVAVIA
ncbi:MAG TPA: serine/threonine-protein kinase [Kofleriaceae bacterium]